MTKGYWESRNGYKYMFNYHDGPTFVDAVHYYKYRRGLTIFEKIRDWICK